MDLYKNNIWQRLSALVSEGFYIVEDSRFTYVNPALCHLVGTSPDKVIGKKFTDFILPGERETALQNYTDRLNGKPSPINYVISLVHQQTGQPVKVRLDVETIVEQEHVVAVMGIVREVLSYENLQLELEQTRSLLTNILENIPDTVYQTNMQGEVTLISKSVESLLGYTPAEMLGTKLADYYWTPEERAKVVQGIVDNNGVITNVEAILKCKDGSPIWISTNAYVNKDESGQPVSIEGLARDVTKQKDQALKLEAMALTDSLTGLPNRRALMDELHKSYTAAIGTVSPLSVMYFDANGFKKINDQYGHLIGDDLLKHIASLLQGLKCEGCIRGRLSGDEFLCVMPNADSDQAIDLANQFIRTAQSNPLVTSHGKISVSLAIGISQLVGDDKNEFSLLDRADKAMYAAKNGSSGIEVL